MKQWMYWLLTGCLVAVIIWVWPPGTWLVSDIQLDGKFADWRGRTMLDDSKEASEAGQDFKTLSWATNENDTKLYFMIERYAPQRPEQRMDCRLLFDVNGNGSYSDLIDKYAQLTYQPRMQGWGDVEVALYTMAGELKGKYAGRWGTGTNATSSNMEFSIPMKDLQAYPAQPMRFYLSGMNEPSDRLPDQGDIQWAPFPVVSKDRSAIALTCMIWMAVTVFFYRHRLWVFYYIWGSVGLCCVMVLFFHASFAEYQLEKFTSVMLHYILSFFGVVTYVFDKAPGTLLVLIKVDTSWTTIAIDIENSALVEMCILFSLLIFYPVFAWRKRLVVALTGIVGVYMINLIRLLIVITLIHIGGRNMSFIAQTLFGRLVFFLLTIALYWQLITRPSLTKIRRNVQND